MAQNLKIVSIILLILNGTKSQNLFIILIINYKTEVLTELKKLRKCKTTLWWLVARPQCTPQCLNMCLNATHILMLPVYQCLSIMACHLLVMVGTHISMSHPDFVPECSLMVVGRTHASMFEWKKVTSSQGKQHWDMAIILHLNIEVWVPTTTLRHLLFCT